MWPLAAARVTLFEARQRRPRPQPCAQAAQQLHVSAPHAAEDEEKNGDGEADQSDHEINHTEGKGDDLYRRSLYTVWKRSSPPPSATSFDAAERLICTVSRQRTSTPLQALVLLNEPQ